MVSSKSVQSETDYQGALYSLIESLKPNASPIFRPQRIPEKFFQLRKTPHWDTFGGLEVNFWKCLYVKVGCVTPPSKGMTLVKWGFSYDTPYG